MTETQHHEEETTLRSYLLGLASAEEQKRVEERLLTDKDYFNELERVEECLTDEYVRGEIKEIEKEYFEQHFLKNVDHYEGLEFARLLDGYFSDRDVSWGASLPSTPKWRGMLGIVLTSAAIILMAASVLLFRQVSNLRGEVAHLQQERVAADEQLRSLAGHLAHERKITTALLAWKLENERLTAIGFLDSLHLRDPDIVSVSLNPGLGRTGGNVRRAIIPIHAQALRLELKLQGVHYRNYGAQVETAEGDVIWTANGLIPHSTSHSRQKAVILVLPVASLTQSQYLVRLTRPTQSGTAENVDTYYLNITRK